MDHFVLWTWPEFHYSADSSACVLKPFGFSNFRHGKTSFPDPFQRFNSEYLSRKQKTHRKVDHFVLWCHYSICSNLFSRKNEGLNATPPPRTTSADTRNKKFSSHFPIWRAEDFFLNRKENFVSGVLPSRIKAVGEARFGLGKVKTIFWGFGFHFSETDF